MWNYHIYYGKPNLMYLIHINTPVILANDSLSLLNHKSVIYNYYSPARQGWRGTDVLFVENRHLEMLLL